jgi:hypothetical protein
MGSEHVGYVEFDERFYRFRSARCSYQDGKLYAAAEGDKCELCLPGMPFPDTAEIADLVGKVYNSTTEVVHSTGMSEGHIRVGNLYLSFERLKVKCKSVDSTKNELALSLQADAEDRINGGSGDVDCGVRCEITEGGFKILRKANKA